MGNSWLGEGDERCYWRLLTVSSYFPRLFTDCCSWDGNFSKSIPLLDSHSIKRNEHSLSSVKETAAQTTMNALPPPAIAPRQLPISLFTRHESYQIPQSTYMIPSTWRRFQLSELINKVLGHTADSGKVPVPFDFLVEGEVLRGSLDHWVKKNRGGDEEGEVRVEFVRSLMPPEEVGRIPQEDWIGGLSLARPG